MAFEQSLVKSLRANYAQVGSPYYDLAPKVFKLIQNLVSEV